MYREAIGTKNDSIFPKLEKKQIIENLLEMLLLVKTGMKEKIKIKIK